MNINELLQVMVKTGISDIHFKAGSAPLIRIYGKLISTNYDNFSAKNIEDLANTLMSPEQKAKFDQDGELDMAYSVDGVSRFRVNIYRQRGTIAVTLRVVPFQVRSFEELNLPVQTLQKLSSEPRGLVLIAGVTGAGKTTTLNSMLDYINSNYACNIITIEDPIEFYHYDKQASISQREIGSDTKSFKEALKHVLRQDPDVIAIGEMREFEAVAAGITAAETGHLVLSTIHTIDTVQTIDRIIDMYPQHQQRQIRTQLANVIKGIVAQRLCTQIDLQGRIPATEVLIGTPLVKKLILENKTTELYKAIETGEYYSMHSFDQDIYRLYREKKISLEEAVDKATNPEDLMLRLKGIFREDTSGEV